MFHSLPNKPGLFKLFIQLFQPDVLSIDLVQNKYYYLVNLFYETAPEDLKTHWIISFIWDIPPKIP